ncbi:hypothetical protein JOL79_04980 [Microbispora sp. RL4-1S]|uniref:Uncharacterized protein n=1 Tax=Microbispora oryzae TaxID=2806554 RepID=A0A941ANY2_9ACTN|nr:hypothetical protein [Microbispora oryzae]MBP2703154.1 hypothetical protein [Microbispora oryzae]
MGAWWRTASPAVATRAQQHDAGNPGCPGAGDDFVFQGQTTASYYWDDGSGVNGDTGAPASGLPMQKGLAASPSWPMGTKGYVIHGDKKMPFFVGDRGPGVPSDRGVMIDLDGKTFADLTGGTWNSDTYSVEGAGGAGHILVRYVITQWGAGPGKKGAPVPFSAGAYSMTHSPDPCPHAAQAAAAAPLFHARLVAADGAAPEPQTCAAMTAIVVCAVAVCGARMLARRLVRLSPLGGRAAPVGARRRAGVRKDGVPHRGG